VTLHNPIYMEYEWAMEHFREKTTMFTGQLESMLLTCADATVRSVDFGTKFKEFSDTVLQLRKDYFNAAAELEARGFFSGMWPNRPFQRLPHATSISFGTSGTKAKEDDQATQEEIKELVRQNDAMVEQLRTKLTPSDS
jgi:hypothetical protein